jgi:hypothetical protein
MIWKFIRTENEQIMSHVLEAPASKELIFQVHMEGTSLNELTRYTISDQTLAESVLVHMGVLSIT